MVIEKGACAGRFVCVQDPTCVCGEASNGGSIVCAWQLKTWVGASSGASRQMVVSLPASLTLADLLNLTSRCHKDPTPHQSGSVVGHVPGFSPHFLQLCEPHFFCITSSQLGLHWNQFFILLPLRETYQGAGGCTESCLNLGLPFTELQVKLMLSLYEMVCVVTEIVIKKKTRQMRSLCLDHFIHGAL